MTEPADYISVVLKLARFVTYSATFADVAFYSGLKSGDCEALTATAFIRCVRVFELKGPVQSTLRKINF